MLVNSLLNLCLLLTAAIDPGISLMTHDVFAKTHRSQARLKKHEPLNLPVLVFSQPEHVSENSDFWGQVPPVTFNRVNRGVRQAQVEFRKVFRSVEECIENAKQDGETFILYCQAELIIARLERAAKGQGLKSVIGDPVWEEYELLVKQASPVGAGKIEAKPDFANSQASEVQSHFLKAVRAGIVRTSRGVFQVSRWISEQNQKFDDVAWEFRVFVDRAMFLDLNSGSKTIPQNGPLECE